MTGPTAPTDPAGTGTAEPAGTTAPAPTAPAPTAPATTGDQGRAARKAALVTVDVDGPTSAAFATISSECIAHWRANLDGVVAGRDAESLHQLRVGVRRFRSGVSLLRRPLGDPAELTWLTAEIRELALPLGAARDLDVLLESVEPPQDATGASPDGAGDATRGDEPPGLPALDLTDAQVRRLRERRETAYDEVLEVLAGAAWADAWRHTERFVAKARKRAEADPPIREAAPAALQRRWARVIEQGAEMRELSPPERHAIRIEAKKLRYGAQFFAALWGGSRLSPDGEETGPPLVFAETVAELQDALGLLNDAVVRRGLLESVGAEMPSVDTSALVERAVRAQAAVAARKRFWRKPPGEIAATPVR